MLTRFGVRLPGDLVDPLPRPRHPRRHHPRPRARHVARRRRHRDDHRHGRARRSSNREAFVRAELEAALPHLRRLPDRIDRILTLAGRGDLRVRSIVDEDRHRILRTLVNRALLAAVGRPSSSSPPSCSSRPTRAPTSPPTRGCSRCSASVVSSSVRCCSCASSPPLLGTGRHDPDPRPTPWHVGRCAEPLRARAAGRALLPASGRRRAPRPVGGGDGRAGRCSIGVATGTSEGVTSDLGRAADQLPGTARELLLALVQVAAIGVPAAVVAVLVATRRWRRLGDRRSAPPPSARAVFWALDAAFDLSDALPGAVTTGTWVASPRFPSLAYVSAVAAAAAVGQAVAGAPVAAGRRSGAARARAGHGDRRHRRASPSCCWRWPPAPPRAPPCWSSFGAPNRRPAPADVRAALRRGWCRASTA